MVVKWSDTNLISSGKDISQTLQVIELEQNEGEFTLDFSIEKLVPLLEVF